jgi:hypothetical protein
VLQLGSNFREVTALITGAGQFDVAVARIVKKEPSYRLVFLDLKLGIQCEPNSRGCGSHRHVEQQHFGRIRRFEHNVSGLIDRDTVTGLEALAVERH